MKKKILARLLAVILTLGILCPTALAADTGVKRFPDVSPDAWYYEAVTVCASDHLMSWYTDGNFHPEKEMRVCDVILTLMKAFYGEKGPTAAADQKAFNWESPDWVPTGFAKDYMAKATRQQTCALIMLAMEQPVDGKDPIEMALNARYISTYGEPQAAFTRAEMASVLYGMMYGIYADTSSIFVMDYELAGFDGQDALEAQADMEAALEKVPMSLKAAFIDSGMKLYACTPEAYTEMWKVFTSHPIRESSGMFLNGKGILVNNLTSQTVTHEFGHFLAAKCGDEARMQQLYEQEGFAILNAAGRDYGSTTVDEFMAESFRVYCTRSANLRLIPNTSAYIEEMLATLG